jgi:sensor domain CHASE-containing protein/nitrogen-specific signal transduction histidine kinase/ActR/RegA family two-component response regulator
MQLRTKTLAVTGLVFAGLLGLGFFAADSILLNSFLEVEEHGARENAARVRQAVQQELQTLSDITFDWAAFDDTYQFITDRNTRYIEANLLTTSFTTIRVDIMVFLDNDGCVVFEKAVDLETGDELPIPKGLHRHLQPTDPLLQLPDPTSEVRGIVSLVSGPLLIVARPIIKTSDQGPIRGTLVIARRLDERKLARFSEDTRLELVAHSPPAGRDPIHVRSRSDDPNAGIEVKIASSDSISAFTTLQDIYGAPALVIEARLDRRLYQRGEFVLSSFIYAFVLAGVLTASLLVLFVDRSVLARLIRIGDVLKDVARNPESSARVEVSGNDELVQLGRNTNRMLDALGTSREELSAAAQLLEARVAERTAQLRDTNLRLSRELEERKRLERQAQLAQKLDALGVLAGGIAHDFNNQLVGILGNLSLSLEQASPGSELAARLEEAARAAESARSLTRQLLTFAKGGAPIRNAAVLSELIRETSMFALSGSKVRCEFAMDDPLWSAEVDRDQISHVISNLVINAKESMPEGGTIRIRANNDILGDDNPLGLVEGRYVHISVADEGIGIAPEDLSRVFDPYFSTKAGGSGLGLAASWSIIEQHDGSMSAESTPGAGTSIHIFLPATEVSELRKPEQDQEPRRGEGRVLVMDDDSIVRKVAVGMLEKLGYRAESVPDGDELIRLYGQATAGGDPFDAVIMDLTIPGGIGGEESLARLLEIDPEARVIVSSGYSESATLADYRSKGFRAALPKPYRIAQLSVVVASVISEA